jgi:tetratricopeptide (TPR) repeat protein
MNTAIELIRGELERLFSLDELVKLSETMLGLSPDEIGGTTAKASFARALTERCAKGERLEALVDVMRAFKREIDPRVLDVPSLLSSFELRAGDAFGSFVIERKLGESHSSIVYVAKDGDRRVTLKVLKNSTTRDRASAHRFLAANRLIAGLDAVGLPRHVEAGERAGLFFVSYDHVEGQTLAEKVQKSGPMRFEMAKEILLKVLGILDTLHRNDLCHGDLKLENVVVAANGEVTLIDFGTDRLRQRATSANGHTGLLAVYGSPRSIAPELVRGRAADAKSDIYAFGAMMYELLSGKPIFHFETATDAAFLHLSQEPAAPSAKAPAGWIGKDVDLFVLALLEKEPSRRPKNAQETIDRMAVLGRASRQMKAVTVFTEEKLNALVDAFLADPTNTEPQLALEHASEEGADGPKIVAAFMKGAAALPEGATLDTKKGILYRAARVCEHAMRDHAAAEVVYKQILAVDPADDVALVALDEVRRAQGKYEEIVETLLERSSAAPAGVERARVLADIGHLYATELDDADQAIVAYTQALAEEPNSDAYAHQIEQLCAGKPARWSEALESITDSIKAGALAPEARAQLLLRAGRWYDTKLNKGDFAVHAFQEVLAQEPANERAAAYLSEIYRRAQQWPELVALLEKRAEIAGSAPRSRDLRAEAADVYEVQLNDLEAAKRLNQSVLTDEPAHPQACMQLARVAERLGDMATVVRVLEARTALAPMDEKPALLMRMAEACENDLNDHEAAAKHYEAVLALEPTHLNALKGLDRLHNRAGRYHQLLDVLERQVEHSATPRQKLALLERIAAIQDEEFLDHAKAAQTLEEMVHIDPSHDGALTGLVRHYRALNRWDRAVAILERHADATTDEARKVDLHLARARTLADHVGSPAAATKVYETVLQLVPNHPAALEALAQLRESAGDAHAALSAIEALATKAPNAETKSEQWMRAGKLLESRGDKDSAIERYRLALDANPANVAASGALRKAYVERGDFANVVLLLDKEVSLAETDLARARLYGEMAVVYHRELGDPEKAEVSAKKALDLDATALAAAMVLGDLAHTAGRPFEATTYYESLATRTAALCKEDATRVLVRYIEGLGRTLKPSQPPPSVPAPSPSSTDLESASRVSTSGPVSLAPTTTSPKLLMAVKALRETAPGDVVALASAAQVLFDCGDPRTALEMHEDLLANHGSELAGADRAEALFHYGESARRCGELEKAVAPLEEASNLEPSNPRPIRALAKVHEERGDWQRAIDIRRRRFALAPEPEQFELLLEIGDLEFGRLADPKRAQKTYVEALQLRPSDRKLLAKLMQLYSQEQDWTKLVDVVLRLADFVEDTKQRAKYMHTAASITAKQLARPEDAIPHYELALSLDPSLTKAQTELCDLYQQRGEHTHVKRMLNTMLDDAKRVEDRERIVRLLDQLGDLYQKFLGEPEMAIEAYEAAQAFDPDSKARAELLASLYATDVTRYLPKAVAVQAQLLRKNPYKVEAYKTLRKLYTDSKRADPAWCMCQALSVLNLAEPDEERFYNKYRAETPATAKAVMGAAEWAMVVHDDVDDLLTSLFALIEPTILRARGEPLESMGYDVRYAIDPALHPYPVSQTLYYARGVFGMKCPLVFQNPKDPSSLGFIHARTPAIILGRGAFDTNLSPQEMAFNTGRHLSYYRPGHYVRHLVPTGTGLKAWLFAAVKIAVPQFPVAADMTGQVAEATTALNEDFKGPQRDRLISVVTKLMQSGGALDLKKWVAGIDATADRAGFLLAHDLEVATATIRATEESSSMSVKERLKELVLFSISEDYFGLREKLSVTIDS